MNEQKPTTALVRAALRTATNSVHLRLHRAPPFVAIAEERLSLEAFSVLLGKLAKFHFTVADELDLDDDRIKLLARDLIAVGMPSPARVPWPGPASPAERLGWIYVVEGSMIGGRVIYRQLDYLFGDNVDGRRFFAGLPDGSVRWQTLCRQIEREGALVARRNDMIVGARAAFCFFERILLTEPADV